MRKSSRLPSPRRVADTTLCSAARRVAVIPDTQVRPGVPLEHLDWRAEALLYYRPDVVVHLGDRWDMGSLSSYEKAGGLKLEGARIKDDIDAGNEAFIRLFGPMQKEVERQRRKQLKNQWTPECHYLFGNHENGINRAVAGDAKYEGVLTTEALLTPGHGFLEIVEMNGVHYSHYFSNTHSRKPIGGSIDNRLNKMGHSLVAGHEQALLYGCRQYPGTTTRHGLVAGSPSPKGSRWPECH